jgi:hypothetical protein
MRRLTLQVTLLSLLVAGLGLEALTTPLDAAPGSSSEKALLCQQGGWKTLSVSDGTLFASEEACVHYAVQRGILAPMPDHLISGGQSRGDGVLSGTGFSPGSEVAFARATFRDDSYDLLPYFGSAAIDGHGAFRSRTNYGWCGRYVRDGIATIDVTVRDTVNLSWTETLDLVSYCPV